MSIELRIKRTPDESSDIYASGASATCETCQPLLGLGYPLWGMHLQAAINLHAAHRLVDDMRAVPALTEDDRRFGRSLGVLG